MASRRDLKKNVNYISNMSIGICLLAEAESKEKKSEITSGLILEILDLRKEIISRISHTEPGNVKAFYKKLYSDFNNGIAGIINKLNELDK